MSFILLCFWELNNYGQISLTNNTWGLILVLFVFSYLVGISYYIVFALELCWTAGGFCLYLLYWPRIHGLFPFLSHQLLIFDI